MGWLLFGLMGQLRVLGETGLSVLVCPEKGDSIPEKGLEILSWRKAVPMWEAILLWAEVLPGSTMRGLVGLYEKFGFKMYEKTMVLYHGKSNVRFGLVPEKKSIVRLGLVWLKKYYELRPCTKKEKYYGLRHCAG